MPDGTTSLASSSTSPPLSSVSRQDNCGHASVRGSGAASTRLIDAAINRTLPATTTRNLSRMVGYAMVNVVMTQVDRALSQIRVAPDAGYLASAESRSATGAPFVPTTVSGPCVREMANSAEPASRAGGELPSSEMDPPT